MKKQTLSEDTMSSAESSLDLATRRDSIARRLDDGYARIDEALLAGSDVAEWESFWLRLLREYEEVCRELDVAA